MKYLLLPLLLLLDFYQAAWSQDSIRYSLLLIGDAGEITPIQGSVITDAVKRSVPGKTSALFLGDNIYRRGMGLDGIEATKTAEILRRQYLPLRATGTPVYFIPGNHDWDHSGLQGYDKMIKVNDFIRAQQDSLLQMIPQDACPGPVEISLTDDITLIAIDSEWWLYPFDKHLETAECECETQSDILGKLADIIERNRNKIVFFASHHPFNTNGSHGGFYSLKEHVFPLTGLNKNLYLPLPVIGSLYPLLRTGFPPLQDVKNNVYRDMKARMENILKEHPNLIHVSGHEHALQLTQGVLLEIGSGAGCKYTPVRMGRGSLFAKSQGGYAKADVMLDNSVRITFFGYADQGLENLFTYHKVYTPVPRVPDEDALKTTADDSISIAINENYDKVGKFHRKLFGENYRNTWAAKVTLPVLRLSDKGLIPTQRGGGMQTRSLRLEDSSKKEWVLRSTNKYTDMLLPQQLDNTLAEDLLQDNFTASFPYAPLTVPVFADALGIHHSNPVIVYVAPDKNLGIYNRDFANTIHLLEEREPLGKSVSTLKMMEKLKEDNDNTMDQKAFLRARMLDILIGDWDRHGDQWRWIDAGKAKAKYYRPIPRDRDQVFYTSQGFFPGIVSLPWIQPKLQGFGVRIPNISTFSFNARYIDGLFTNQLSYEDWLSITSDVVSRIDDMVIESALKKLPPPVYEKTNFILASQLKNRRLELQKKAPQFHRFLNKVVDVAASDKNEWVKITDTLDNKLSVTIHKISKKGEVEQAVFSRVFDPDITKELRLFLFGGSDSVFINNNRSNIKLRIVADGKTGKKFSVAGNSKYLRKVHIYDGLNVGSGYEGDLSSVRLHQSDNPANTNFQVTERYNKTIPLLSIGYNADDGLLLGAGVKLIRQGFRKVPYASMHQINLTHAFTTGAFRLRYSGEWLKSIGEADLFLNAAILAPDNTQNFFGRGNETPFNKSGNYRRFYRAVFTILEANPAIGWKSGVRNLVTIGPSVQYYHFDATDNQGRFINNTSLIHSYDSATVENDKSHAGIILNFTHDNRSSLLLPVSGSLVNLRIKGYGGLNTYSKSFVQVTTEIALFKSIDRRSDFIIANRLGGGATFGKTTFYQSLFLGGHENLLGFRQYRFAGEQLLYNNLEARIKLVNVASYIVPGQLGLLAFYDVGRVWEKGLKSTTWHQGVGAGLYFSPAQLVLIQLVAGKSTEGWYPYLTMGFRF